MAKQTDYAAHSPWPFKSTQRPPAQISDGVLPLCPDRYGRSEESLQSSVQWFCKY